MKPVIFSLLLVTSAAFAADVGVSITLGQPGFHGQVTLGGDLMPRLVMPQPVMITPPQAGGTLAPLYLRVPPGHLENWGSYCSRYNACSRQVFFVDGDWYEREYVPRYREHHEGHGGHGKHKDRGHLGKTKHGRGHDRD